MTVRAVLIGLICAAAICGFCLFNDFIMRQTFLVGNYMPISVYGGVLLFLLVINPVLLLAWRRLALSGRELAVIVALTLAACYVPGRGLMHYFCTTLIMPHHYVRTRPGWKKAGVVEMAPKPMLAGVPPWYRGDDVLDGPVLCAKLIEEGGAERPSVGRRVWALLPEEVRATAREVVAAAPVDEARKARIAQALSQILSDRSFYEKEDFDGISLQPEEKELLKRERETLSDEEVKKLNRGLLGSAYPKAMAARRRAIWPLDARDISDWPRFCSKLRRQARRGRPSPGRRLWQLLPGDVHTAVEGAIKAAELVEARHRKIIDELNCILRKRGFYGNEDFVEISLPDKDRELLQRERRDLSEEDVAALNRHLLDASFPQGLRSIGASEDLVINGFVQGLGVGEESISLSDIPWHAWTRTLRFWLPLLVSFSIAMIGLALVVHRQWSDHEQLAYPIVTFANTLLPEKGRAWGEVFRNRLFWISLCLVLVIHMNNYAHAWWPRYLVEIPRRFDFMSLLRLFPVLQRANPWALLNPTIYFTAVGFAFFLATDVSLSLGLAPFVYEIAVGILVGYGVAVGGGGFISLNIRTFLYGGAYFGMFLVLLYTGRHYYRNVLRRSVFLPARERVESHAVWGARVFLLGAALFAGQLVLVGLSWYLAVLYTVGAVMIFVVISRLVAETGVFFIHAYHFPCVLMWGFLGARVLGPKAMLIMFLVTSLLLIDPRESVMPFFVQGLKLVDLKKVRVGRTAAFGALALVVGFAVAVPVTLYLQYDKGAGKVGDGWTRGVPRMAFDATVRVREKLEKQGTLEEAGTYSGSDWLRNISLNSTCVLAFGISMGLVLLFAAARLRFPRWPFHPVMFLVLGTFQSRTLAVSFLLGCLIKVLVTKYGGASAYQKVKPLMIGVIAGDMLGGVLPMIIGGIYYSCTLSPPVRFVVLPL